VAQSMTLHETHLNQSALNGDILASRRIRTTALGIFWNANRILVAECYDPIKGETFYRPLGGGVDFGERGHDALVREMREETNLEVANLRYVGTLENIFTYMGNMGHEIVILYEGEFTDRSVYDNETLECHEETDCPFIAVWKRLDEFGSNTPLYPNGLMDLLISNTTTRTNRE
jgi:8-oxo-dGTP pyrophosphatase MutT (NUDIX family)